MPDRITKNSDADLSGLNPAQLAVVTHETGPLLVVAGAGTGKTMAISRRMAWLINGGHCRPDGILALTFTDKAAQEMVARVEDRLPLGYPDLWVSTFHAFCRRILKEHALDIGLPNDFRLLNETDAYLLVRRNLDRFDLDYYRPLGNPGKFIRAMLKHFSRAKDEAIEPDEYLDFVRGTVLDGDGANADAATDERTRMNELANAYHAYQRLLFDEGCLDVGDLIVQAIRLFRQRPSILERYRGQFREVIVDEFQDTNWAQYELLRMLAPPNGNIIAVGDDDQAIYRFRGASVSNILRFKEDYPTATEVVLTENYRSRQGILDLAHDFIQLNNPDRLEAKLSLSKRLTAVRAGSAEISHLRFADGESEAAGVVNRIVGMRQGDPGLSWSDFAVLVRSNVGAEPFSLELNRRGIPFQFLALRGLYGKPVVIDILAYFRLLDNYHESSALFRTLSSPPYRIDGNDLIEMVHQAKRSAKSVFEVMRQHRLLKGLRPETGQTVERLLGHLERHTRLSKEKSVSELLVAYLYDSDYVSELKREETPEERERVSFVNQFLNRIRRFESASETGQLREFMEEFVLEQESGESGGLDFDPETGPDMVRVMTIHAAKGLEFPVVFIGQMADRRFPSSERGGDIPLPEGLGRRETRPGGDVHLQEERRLFYVAITRAKDRLFLTSSEDYGGKTKRKPSVFLADLGLAEASPEPAAVSLSVCNRSLPPTVSVPADRIPQSLSYTQLAAYASCPLQYRYAHILRLPIFGKPAFSFGRTVHLTLERFMKEWSERSARGQADLFGEAGRETGSPVSVGELLEIYGENWQDEWYPDAEEKEGFRRKGREILERFHRDIAANPPKVRDLEREFTVPIGGTVIKGKIDRIDDLADGTVGLVDYKTGSPKDRTKLDIESRRQLLLYQVAAEKALGLKPSKLTFHYLEDGSKIEFFGQEKDLVRLEDHIREIVDRIRAGNFAPTPGWQCQYCDFGKICEFKAKG
ncbi:UvrD-helicase domain-containing protein [Candidatus Uhrbacteria bacterium]|nr:UvrD-helicase domain-containing protein [Candidatus Uhrbacteria bacterium]